MATTTNRLSMLTMYFQQFQEKKTPYKAKALIEERINSDKKYKKEF